jgi:hypothetical protein
MRHHILVSFAVLAAAQPAMAEPPNKPVATASTAQAEPAIDAHRLALGRQIAGAFFPDGTIQKMMSQMSGVQSGMMKGMFDKTPKDLGVAEGKDSDKTLGQLVREKDPYFEERMTITNKVMMEEMGNVMGELEPQIRESIARIYAKRFTLAELNDIATFFRSPSGKAYGERLMPMMSDPEYVNTISAMMPKIMQAMPGIMEKVKKATANLPPPPKDDDKAKPAALPTT